MSNSPKHCDEGPARRIGANPFYVLGLSPDVSNAEIEVAAQRLFGALAANLPEADRYSTPLGPRKRTPEAVRAAVEQLRDPVRRLVHEAWAALPAGTAPPMSRAKPAPSGWSRAFETYGWRRR